MDSLGSMRGYPEPMRRSPPRLLPAGPAGCGDDDVSDQADKLRKQAEDLAGEIEQQGRELKKEIRQGASEAEVRDQLDEIEKEAKGKGEDAQREAERAAQGGREAARLRRRTSGPPRVF